MLTCKNHHFGCNFFITWWKRWCSHLLSKCKTITLVAVSLLHDGIEIGFYRILKKLSRNKIVVDMQNSSLWLQFLYYMMKPVMLPSLCQNAKIITLMQVSLLPDEIVIFTSPWPTFKASDFLKVYVLKHLEGPKSPSGGPKSFFPLSNSHYFGTSPHGILFKRSWFFYCDL